MRHFANAADYAATVGEKHGPSDWVEVTQAMIDAFAEATGNRQWIHVDPARAAREVPGGRTIAHGYLTLSLLGTLMPGIQEYVGANRGRHVIHTGGEHASALHLPVQTP